MSKLGYVTTGNFRSQDRQRFKKFSRAEYYEAELTTLAPDDRLELQIDKVMEAPYLLATTTTSTPYRYSRRWEHIRRDRADICVLHYVKDGVLHVLHHGVRCTVEPGEFVIVRSNAPYEIEYHPGSNIHRAVVYVSLPPDMVQPHFAGRSMLGRVFSPASGRGNLSHDLINFIYDHAHNLTPATAKPLLSALCAELASLALPADGRGSDRRTLQQYRVEKIRAYLELHVTNPDLSARMVAEACEISERYMSYLLARCDTTFSETVWNLRIARATEWLESASLVDVPVGTLAFQAGFKSASHFSHVFKAARGCTPGEYRRQALRRAS